jgi:hypothetical protein
MPTYIHAYVHTHKKCRGADFPMATRTSTVSERAEIHSWALYSHLNLPLASPPRLGTPPFVHWPETLVLRNSKRPMRARATKMDAPRRGAAWYPCFAYIRAFKTTHSASGTGLRGPSKFFRALCLQVRFSGAARLCRAPKKVLCSSKPSSCAVSHVLLCFCRRILVAYIFKVHMYWLWRWAGQQHTQQHTNTNTNTHTHTHTHILLRCLCGVRFCLMVWKRERVHACMCTGNPGISA